MQDSKPTDDFSEAMTSLIMKCETPPFNWITQWLRSKNRKFTFGTGEIEFFTWNTDIVNYSAYIPPEKEDNAWLFVAYINSPRFFPNGKFGFKAADFLFSFYLPPTQRQFNALMDILDIP